jgi:hypothetical protein
MAFLNLSSRSREFLEPSPETGFSLRSICRIHSIMKDTRDLKQNARCAYLKACYIAEDLKCYGYKTDCPLFMKSNGESCSELRFHDAMDRLIDGTRAKHLAANLTT